MSVTTGPEAWAHVAPYLDQVLDLEPGEREAWLSELAITQSNVVHTLRQLLAERDELNTKGFLSHSPLQANDATVWPELAALLQRRASVESGDWLMQFSPPDLVAHRLVESVSEGQVLGPYRLLREIGQGGMSSVWLAERLDGQLKREIALKLPYVGPQRMQLVERFQRERDILATLTHANIARIYDAGVSESGQPYLAMEYVQGTSLLQYCDAACLNLRERLRLFMRVLNAVRFAHAHLVIHRDLKPSNIFVTSEQRVVLLDFGIAKLLTGAANESQLTEMAGRPLTPDYASPEQIAAQPLGTASDIYSLGVVLYELLTGSRPYRPKRDSRGALEEAILTDDAQRPSQAAPSEAQSVARATTPKKLSTSLKGDLDTIVLKALKKNPAERYVSVDAFLHDIDSYLHSRPVSARPDGAGYRFGRFVARNKLPVGAAAVAMLAVVGGGAAALWQARAAAQERDRAVALASRNDAISTFTDALITEAAASKKPVTIKEMLARSEQIALADTSDTNENRAAILAVLARHQQGLGDSKKAAELLEQALALLRNSRDRSLRSQFVCDHALSIADLGQSGAAVRAITEELKSLNSDPETAAICLFNRSHILAENLDSPGTLRDATLALERLRQSGKKTVIGGEGIFLGAVAYAHYMNGDTAQANRYFDLALRKYVESGHGNSSDAITVRNNWALALAGSGNPKRALELYDETAAIVAERDRGDDPPLYLVFNRAGALEQLGRFAAARSAYQWLCEYADRQHDSIDKVYCLLSLASVDEKEGERAAATDHLNQAAEILARTSSDGENLALMKLALVRGRVLLAERKFVQARQQFDLLLVKKAKNVPTMEAELGQAEVALGLGDAQTARDDAQAAMDIAKSLQGSLPYSYRTGLAQMMVGRALQKGGDLAAARAAFRSAIDNLSNTVDESHPQLARARGLLEQSG